MKYCATFVNLALLVGLVVMVTPASASTYLFTDGKIHVSWIAPSTQQLLRQSDNNPPPFPIDVEFCEYGNYGLDEQVPNPNVIVIEASQGTIVHYIEACEEFLKSERSSPRESRDTHRQKRDLQIQAIYPGTKWCGTGDIAKNYKDLGMLRSLDKCCRKHDHCKDILENGQSRGGITNNRGYTMLNCDCDEKFRDCLYKLNDFAANTVGGAYFNVLANKCYVVKKNGKLQVYRSIAYEPCVEVDLFKSIFAKSTSCRH